MSEEKLNELKEKVAGLQEELKELTPEELGQVFGGVAYELLPLRPLNSTLETPVNPFEL